MHRIVLLASCFFACSDAPTTPPTPDATTDECATSVAPRPGTVLTSTGPVTGASDSGVWSWKGIPYAAPPIGTLRWRPPQPAACWTDERIATSFGAVCPQLADGTVIGDEDCLTLNVWAPDNASGAPVLVFIHGGGNIQGSASDPLYDGAALAKHSGAVVVTLEYRLGALGFFAHPTLSAESAHGVSGNYGILDQIAALTWVRDNIAAFGGAPDRVLLFGESAGAQDTLIHFASPLSKGLFAAALVESGGTYGTTLAENEAAMQPVIDGANCAAAADIPACLRGASVSTLVSIPSAEGPLARGMRYVPSIDGYVLPDDISTLIKAGSHNPVPLVIGTNADETSRMVPQVTTDAEYQAAVQMLYGPAANALLALYPSSSYPSPLKALIRLTTDVTWTCPARKLLRTVAAHQTAPVYRYHFTWTVPGPVGARVGATHGLELPFVFRTFSALGFAPAADDLALADSIDTYWTNLATTGDPNDGTSLAWPRYDIATDPYLRLDRTLSAGAGLATTQCDALDALAP